MLLCMATTRWYSLIHSLIHSPIHSLTNFKLAGIIENRVSMEKTDYQRPDGTVLLMPCTRHLRGGAEEHARGVAAAARVRHGQHVVPISTIQKCQIW